MIELLRDIEARLESRSYSNEAAVREGIVVPILRALGWNTFDPDEVRPEYPNPAGRVDYALLQRGGRPAVLIEVKAVGRSLEGDRQLFGYCFEEGVPLAVLTDGQSWNFYLPAGVGRIDERRIYSLQLSDRSAEEAERVLSRYLAKERIADRSAFAAARDDHEKAFNSREAAAALPIAWHALETDRDERLIEVLQDKAEALCGFRPSAETTGRYLQTLSGDNATSTPLRKTKLEAKPASVGPAPPPAAAKKSPRILGLEYTIFGQKRTAASASAALVDVLRTIVARDPAKIGVLSDRVKTRTRRHVARTPEEIYPSRPHFARAEEISPGWLVGLNIDNRDKQMIIQEACEIYGIAVPDELDLALPNT